MPPGNCNEIDVMEVECTCKCVLLALPETLVLWVNPSKSSVYS